MKLTLSLHTQNGMANWIQIWLLSQFWADFRWLFCWLTISFFKHLFEGEVEHLTLWMMLCIASWLARRGRLPAMPARIVAKVDIWELVRDWWSPARVYGCGVRGSIFVEVSLPQIVVTNELLHVVFHDISMACQELLIADDGRHVLRSISLFTNMVVPTDHVFIWGRAREE